MKIRRSPLQYIQSLSDKDPHLIIWLVDKREHFERFVRESCTCPQERFEAMLSRMKLAVTPVYTPSDLARPLTFDLMTINAHTACIWTKVESNVIMMQLT